MLQKNIFGQFLFLKKWLIRILGFISHNRFKNTLNIQGTKYINELPNKWNWLRLQIEHDNEDSNDKKIMHWTGAKGNDRIKGLMKIKEAIRA